MIFRLSDFINYGRIDNSIQGIVRLELWFNKCDQPMHFKLQGDCLQDIAGCITEFAGNSNSPAPDYLDKYDLFSSEEEGIVGDMTASKVVNVSPTSKRADHQLYLEWFSLKHGMFLIEINQPNIRSITLPTWNMDAQDEQVQLMCNQQALHDYVAAWISQYASHPDEQDPLPDSHWDIRLREAEGAAIAYQEIHRKYKSELFSETREAFVMGLSEKLEELATSDENGSITSSHINNSLSIFDLLNEDEAIDAQLGMSHPLFQQIMTLSEAAQRLFSSTTPHEKIDSDMNTIFWSLRYITPNVLSCILQLNEGNADYQILAKRLSRCADRIAQAVDSMHKIDIRGGKRLIQQLETLHKDIVALMNNLSKQGKR